MRISTLLNAAKKARTDVEIAELLENFKAAFLGTRALGHLPTANDEAYLEKKGCPHLQFELNRVISNEYITMIRPEIRDGIMTVGVTTHRMLDKLGMASQKWEELEDFDNLLHGNSTKTVKSLAQVAKLFAIDHHGRLIRTVGVSDLLADKTAKKSW